MTENNEAAAPPPPAAEPAPARNCENCGRALLGDYCYACGQPVKGLVRHFSSIIGDFADSVLNLDTRLPRTLWPLLARPGFLTNEYFAGRRVRYVSPVRLFVFISIVTFFIAQLTVSFGDGTVKFDDGGDSLDKAATVQEVEKIRDQTLAELAEARKNVAGTPGAGVGIQMGEEAIRKRAQARIEALRKAQAGSAAPVGAAAEAAAATATSATTPASDKTQATPTTPASTTKNDDDEDFDISFNDRPWDAKTNPIAVAWLPRFANDWLNSQAGRIKGNFKRLKEDPNALKDAVLSAVPSTLFILLPLFAVMLKILYVFKRRLYMEHLIVALHSHAFLCLALLLMFVTMTLQSWLAPDSGALHSLFGWIEALLWVWMPIYLLLMQKRVYAQGWLMTLVKYCVLGICYFFLLTVGALFTMLFSLVNM